jgi:hypothetical protein
MYVMDGEGHGRLSLLLVKNKADQTQRSLDPRTEKTHQRENWQSEYRVIQSIVSQF